MSDGRYVEIGCGASHGGPANPADEQAGDAHRCLGPGGQVVSRKG